MAVQKMQGFVQKNAGNLVSFGTANTVDGLSVFGPTSFFRRPAYHLSLPAKHMGPGISMSSISFRRG
jgi:hypothetical protein